MRAGAQVAITSAEPSLAAASVANTLIWFSPNLRRSDATVNWFPAKLSGPIGSPFHSQRAEATVPLSDTVPVSWNRSSLVAPDAGEAMVIAGGVPSPKLAVTVLLPVIVIVIGLFVPSASPLQPAKTNPPLATAVTVT